MSEVRLCQEHPRFQASCSNCGLAGICLPIGVSGADLDRLDSIIERGRPLQRGEHIYRAGDPFDSLYAVRSGAIKSYRVTESGEEQIMGFHLPGEIFGLSGIGTHVHPNAALALETSAVCQIPFDSISDLSRRLPSLQGHVFALMSREITDEQQMLILLSKKTAEARIASLLLSLSSRHAQRRLSASRLRLPMSRSDIGNYLGLVVETVSRIFTRFQKKGLIRVDGREVEILDSPALHLVADVGVVD